MKIGEGDFIRTKNQGIKRVKKIEYDKDTEENYYYFDNIYGIWEHHIIKHSKNIIDLIEAGDYVNGLEVLDIYIPRDLWDTIEIRVSDRYINFITLDEIKSILTHEQYNLNCFELEE